MKICPPVLLILIFAFPTQTRSQAIEVPKCSDVTKGKQDCICEKGFCLTRPEVDKINVLILDYPRTKQALEDCMQRPPKTVETGWEPWVVVVVGVALTAAAFGAGFAVAELR